MSLNLIPLLHGLLWRVGSRLIQWDQVGNISDLRFDLGQGRLRPFQTTTFWSSTMATFWSSTMATFSLGPRPDPTARKVGSACLDQGLVPSAKPVTPTWVGSFSFFSFRPYGNCCSLHINGISPASTFSDIDLSISSLLRPSTTFSLGTTDLVFNPTRVGSAKLFSTCGIKWAYIKLLSISEVSHQ